MDADTDRGHLGGALPFRVVTVVGCTSTAGMHPLTENDGQRITVLAFGRLTSSLLAYGSLSGAVRVVRVGDTPVVEQVSSQPLPARPASV